MVMTTVCENDSQKCPALSHLVTSDDSVFYSLFELYQCPMRHSCLVGPGCFLTFVQFTQECPIIGANLVNSEYSECTVKLAVNGTGHCAARAGDTGQDWRHRSRLLRLVKTGGNS